jgi:hypothetical protein
MIMIFIINNALVATGKKVAPTTLAGDFICILSAYYPQISRHSNAMSNVPSQGGAVVFIQSPASVEPIPMGGMICIIY